jgi:hypothetical protein
MAKRSTMIWRRPFFVVARGKNAVVGRCCGQALHGGGRRRRPGRRFAREPLRCNGTPRQCVELVLSLRRCWLVRRFVRSEGAVVH